MTDYNPYEASAAPGANLVPSNDGAGTLASRGSRLAASLLDAVFQVALLVPIQLKLGLFTDFPSFMHQSARNTLLAGVANLTIYVVLNGYLLAQNGQTIGKRLLKIRTVRVEDDQPASLARLVLTRFLPFFAIAQIPVVGDLFSIIDVCFIFRGDRRCIHDHIARTRVTVAP